MAEKLSWRDAAIPIAVITAIGFLCFLCYQWGFYYEAGFHFADLMGAWSIWSNIGNIIITSFVSSAIITLFLAVSALLVEIFPPFYRLCLRYTYDVDAIALLGLGILFAISLGTGKQIFFVAAMLWSIFLSVLNAFIRYKSRKEPAWTMLSLLIFMGLLSLCLNGAIAARARIHAISTPSIIVYNGNEDFGLYQILATSVNGILVGREWHRDENKNLVPSPTVQVQFIRLDEIRSVIGP